MGIFLIENQTNFVRKKIPLHPTRPERVCWGCDKYCAADDLRCGNGTIRTPHPAELFGPDWNDWAADSERDREDSPTDPAAEIAD